MEPKDEFPVEQSYAGRPEELPPTSEDAPDEEGDVDPGMAAALLLSGNFSKALTDRVTSSLTAEEMQRLATGLVRLRHLPESRIERLWTRLTSLYTGDWREEDDLIEFIRSVLREGVRQDPALTMTQRLAMLILATPAEVSESMTVRILNRLSRPAASELTRELAHLLHYPNTQVLERVVGEFLASTAARARGTEPVWNPTMVRMETERITGNDPNFAASFVKRIWLEEREMVSLYQEAARTAPDRMTALLLAYVARGSVAGAYIPGAEKAAHLLSAVTPEVAEVMRGWFASRDINIPDTPAMPARRHQVMREFLCRYFSEVPEASEPNPN